MRQPVIAAKITKEQGDSNRARLIGKAMFGEDSRPFRVSDGKLSIAVTFDQRFVDIVEPDVYNQQRNIVRIGIEACEYGSGWGREAQVVCNSDGSRRRPVMRREQIKTTVTNNHALFWSGEYYGKMSREMNSPMTVITLEALHSSYSAFVREISLSKKNLFSDNKLRFIIDSQAIFVGEFEIMSDFTNKIKEDSPQLLPAVKAVIMKLESMSPRVMYTI